MKQRAAYNAHYMVYGIGRRSSVANCGPVAGNPNRRQARVLTWCARNSDGNPLLRRGNVSVRLTGAK